MPWPPPQFGLSKERSRSRLAVSENIDAIRSTAASVYLLGCRFGGNRAAVAGIGEQDLPLRLDFASRLRCRACPSDNRWCAMLIGSIS